MEGQKHRMFQGQARSSKNVHKLVWQIYWKNKTRHKKL